MHAQQCAGTEATIGLGAAGLHPGVDLRKNFQDLPRTRTEVALLELRGSLLNFLFPVELITAGAIPLSSLAVAARTAQTGKAELFNSFTQVTHFSVFELVKLGNNGLDAQVIQKLMSAPVLSTEGKVWGVIQLSRKAPNQTIAGPDFTPADLQKLELAADIVGRLMTRARHFSGSRA